MTEKEKLVVIEWINNGFNGTKAYMSVYKNCKKESSAAVLFNRLMKKKEVIEFREEWLNDIESTQIASANEILIYLTKVMRGQEKDAFGLDPSLEERTKAAERLMKAKGMFVQKVEVNNESEEKKQQAISNIESLVKQMVPIEEDEISE